MAGRVSRVRWGGAAFLVGAVQFFLAMAVEELLIPGFSPLTNTISDLGSNVIAGSYDSIFNVSVILLGLLTWAGVAGLGGALAPRPSRTAGRVLLVIAGIGAVGVGLFPETHPGPYHFTFALLAFAGSGLALLFLGPAMRGDGRWRGLAAPSVVLGVITLVALVLFATGNYGPLREGGMERLIVAPVLLWAAWAGLRMLRWSPSADSPHPWSPSPGEPDEPSPAAGSR